MADALRLELYDSSGAVWVNAGEVVREFEVVFEGYRPELDEVRSGTATIVVSNQTRAFDPDYVYFTGGPLAALLDPGVFLRLILNVGGVDYTVYTGITDRITQGYDPGDHDAIATFEATDDRLVSARCPPPSRIAPASRWSPPGSWERTLRSTRMRARHTRLTR